MSGTLKVALGQYSDKGRKAVNQDCHGACVPDEPQLGTKGVVVAVADGISSSTVSQIASQAAVKGFLADYFCTSEAWSVKRSAQRVLSAMNAWLHAQTRQSQYRYDADRGYVCTFSALVVKSATAHLFHVGDTRIYRLRGDTLEQLTEDHRLRVSQNTSYLGRALGIAPRVEIDYHTLPVERGDVFVLATDGVYEHVDARSLIDSLRGPARDLDAVAREIVAAAVARGSEDNLTLQILRVEDLPDQGAAEVCRQLTELPLPPLLDARMTLDGYRIVREIHASSRSHAYLAVDETTGDKVVIKIPSIDQRGDPAYLERFLMEEWIARRIDNAHVLKPCRLTRARSCQYIALEFVEGQTLAQWMRDHPRPDLKTVRDIVTQIARGLQAFHRREMLHQDLRPENIMIDAAGTVKIIDFGSTRVAGLAEMSDAQACAPILGTEQYSAPEYFLGDNGTTRSDLFSLGVIAYQMLTGKLPYGTRVPGQRTRAAQLKLRYATARDPQRPIPAWVDEALRKAVHTDPRQRYAELSEFIYDLHHPNREFLRRTRPPLLERNPVAFWKTVSLLLTLALIAALYARSGPA